MEESKDYVMNNFALTVDPDYTIKMYDNEQLFFKDLQKVYSWNESYRDSTKIDNEFDFDIAGQCIAYMYKMKVVNYVRYIINDEVHWQTKIHDFQNHNEPVHTMYNELKIQTGKQIEYFTDAAQNSHIMFVMKHTNPFRLYYDWRNAARNFDI